MEKYYKENDKHEIVFKSYGDLSAWKNEQEKHNGWTNYATWRVMLEMVENMGEHLTESEVQFATIYDLSEYIKADCEDLLENDATEYTNGLVKYYALAFVSDVNWYEIAENMATDYQKLVPKN